MKITLTYKYLVQGSFENQLRENTRQKLISYTWSKIIFAGKLRNPYFHHICQIGRQTKNCPKKGTHWLCPGFKIGLNENLTNFREIQENIVLVMSTLIL